MHFVHGKDRKLQLNTEVLEPKEAELISQILDDFKKEFAEEKKVSPIGVRGTHKRTVAALKAEFRIEKNLPLDLRQGLFKEEKIYPAWIRLSRTFYTNDLKNDSSSFCMKVLEVPGKKILPGQEEARTQDFLMRNGEVFYTRNLADFLSLIKNKKKPFHFFFPSWNPTSWRLKEFLIILRQTVFTRVSNPLDEQYWSEVPFLFGSRAMKFSIKPSHAPWKHSIPRSPTYYTQVVSEYLKTREATFDFLIQFQLDPYKMPIEDPTIRWKSPFIRVATIHIPPQDILLAENLERGENLSFNPWHSLPEHRPLGSLNRARKSIYLELSRLRHERNHVEEDLG